MRAGEVHFLAKKIREMRPRLDVLDDQLSVHGELNRFHAAAA
jgi:hypothetical protein